MLKWAKDLFPICRSLAGPGNRETLKYFYKINKEFKTIKFKSGIKVFDWTIPEEWHVKDAFIQHSSGKKFAQFKKNNLHLVGYSTSINKTINKKKLLSKIYTQKNQVNSIPYVTSYYKKNWGFCMSENEKKKLPEGNYKVFIDSTFKKGNLEIAEAVIKGKTKKEVFFSSYICHPSMANNELSGPVLLNALMLFVKKNYPNNNYTYRFVLLPETIGSIAYLSRNLHQLKKNVLCGFVLTCVGDDRKYSFVNTPSENTLADFAIQASLLNKKKLKKYSFINRGSDERQYCYPGVDLPVCSFSRSKEYPEYHTDKDNFKLVTQKGLEGSFDVMKDIIDAFELGLYPKNTKICEPQLGKRNLYTSHISQKGIYKKEMYTRKNLLAYSNGTRSIFEICNILQTPLKEINEQHLLLKKNKLLK